MLFVMNDDVPCVRAAWVQLAPASPPRPAPLRALPGALMAATSSTFEPGTPNPFSGAAYAAAAAKFDFAAGGAAAYSGARGAAVTVFTQGKENWHVQVTGPYVPLSPDKQYAAHFWIRANRGPFNATVLWLRREGGLVPFGVSTFSIDTVFKQMRLHALKPPAPGSYHLQIELGGARAGTTVYLDDIQVCLCLFVFVFVGGGWGGGDAIMIVRASHQNNVNNAPALATVPTQKVMDLTLPPSANPAAALPINGADGGAASGGDGSGGSEPPPPPSGVVVAAASEDSPSPGPYKYAWAQFADAMARLRGLGLKPSRGARPQP
jgi:hypothetical protein